jgi:hypothetical protein
MYSRVFFTNTSLPEAAFRSENTLPPAVTVFNDVPVFKAHAAATAVVNFASIVFLFSIDWKSHNFFKFNFCQNFFGHFINIFVKKLSSRKEAKIAGLLTL